MSAAEIIDEVIINDTPKIRKTIDTSFKEQQNEIFRRLLKIFNIESSENKIIDKTELEYHKDEIEMLSKINSKEEIVNGIRFSTAR
jgi:hypothetical protein